jgi:hypothetical protein
MAGAGTATDGAGVMVRVVDMGGRGVSATVPGVVGAKDLADVTVGSVGTVVSAVGVVVSVGGIGVMAGLVRVMVDMGGRGVSARVPGVVGAGDLAGVMVGSVGTVVVGLTGAVGRAVGVSVTAGPMSAVVGPVDAVARAVGASVTVSRVSVVRVGGTTATGPGAVVSAVGVVVSVGGIGVMAGLVR